MPRNRIIYQSLALYAGNNPPTGAHSANDITQLTRVQSWDSDFSRNFTDVNEYGKLGAIDRIEIEAPTVNMSTSWYPTDGSNEEAIGLVTDGTESMISSILRKETDEKNYFLLVAKEGNDAVGYSDITGVFGVGNTFLTSYSIEASVGDIPTANADFEALNFAVYANAASSNNVPAIDPSTGKSVVGVNFTLPAARETSGDEIKVLRPGDISFTLTNNEVKGFQASDIKIQSFTMSMDLGRTPIEKLGSRFPFSREIDFPLTASLSVEAQMGDLANFNLSELLCDESTYNLTIIMRKNDCEALGDAAITLELKGAKLLSESVTTSIGDNASVSLEYEVSIGGPQDTEKGVFFTGTAP